MVVIIMCNEMTNMKEMKTIIEGKVMVKARNEMINQK